MIEVLIIGPNIHIQSYFRFTVDSDLVYFSRNVQEKSNKNFLNTNFILLFINSHSLFSPPPPPGPGLLLPLYSFCCTLMLKPVKYKITSFSTWLSTSGKYIFFIYLFMEELIFAFNFNFFVLGLKKLERGDIVLLDRPNKDNDR